MRKDAIPLEETRLQGVNDIGEFQFVHERHRIFPQIFENRRHKKILDIASGIGCCAQRIRDQYPSDIICNDISPTSLKVLRKLNLSAVSFDIDDAETGFPFPDRHFDAIISLATIEHLINIDHFMNEISRILKDDGYLYISTPNYTSVVYLPDFLISGRTFHNPLSKSIKTRYEFYAHIRYFTYRTLLEYVTSFNFTPETVYLALPGGSTRYQELIRKSKMKAFIYKYLMWTFYYIFTPRWAPEPVLCFRKGNNKFLVKPHKSIL